MILKRRALQNYQQLKDSELLDLTRVAASSEKEATLILLQHLVEVDKRRAYATLAHSSLFDYLVRGLGLTESSAAERVNAVRLMRSVKGVDQHLIQGGLSVSAAAQIQRFIRNEEKAKASTNQKQTSVSPQTKSDLVNACLGQSKREVEKTLLSKQSEAAKHISQEKVRLVTPQRSEIKFTADESTVQKLERVKELLGNQSLEKIFDLALAALVEKEEKKRGMTPKVQVKSRSQVPSARSGASAVQNPAVQKPAVQKPAPASMSVPLETPGGISEHALAQPNITPKLNPDFEASLNWSWAH